MTATTPISNDMIVTILKTLATNPRTTTGLHCCTTAESVSAMLALGLDMNEVNCTGHTPLGYACRNGNIEVVSALITAGADVNKFSASCPPIYLAAQKGFCVIISKLIDAGADVNAKCSNGETAIYGAVCYGRAEAVALLIAAGAFVNTRTTHKSTPLHRACNGEFTDIVRMLIDAGADTTAKDDRGATPHKFCKNDAIRALFPIAVQVGDFFEKSTLVSADTAFTVIIQQGNDLLLVKSCPAAADYCTWVPPGTVVSLSGKSFISQPPVIRVERTRDSKPTVEQKAEAAPAPVEQKAEAAPAPAPAEQKAEAAPAPVEQKAAPAPDLRELYAKVKAAAAALEAIVA